ncbi:MAG: AsmA family protein [Syntrophotaleaceae bacterium]
MKKLFIAIGVMVILLVGILIFGVSKIGPIIKQAVNTRGPQITGTELKLGDVDIAFFSGQLELQNFLLGNPQGFAAPYAMTVESIKVDLDEKTVTEETVVIDLIAVQKPEIFYEKKAKSDNFQAILKHVKKTVGKGGAEPAAEEKSGKKLLIREFVVQGGQVNLAVPGLNEKITAGLPEIRLVNIGGEQQGVVPAEAARQIVAALYEKVLSAPVRQELDQQLQNLGGEALKLKDRAAQDLERSAREKMGEGVEGASEKLKGLFGQ